MNRDTRVRVRTPVGYTEYSEVCEGLGQGTNESTVISAVNLSGGIEHEFVNSTSQSKYGDLVLKPVLFVDDVNRLAESPEAVQEGNIKMERVAESKLLDFNYDKSSVILIGSKKFIRITKEKYNVNPLKLCNKVIKLSESECYLGDQIGSSLSESVFLTIQRRLGLTKKLISDIIITVNDCRSNTIGGFKVGMEIWNLAVMPYLFYNSECWVSIPKKVLKILNQVQSSFFCQLLQVPKSCLVIGYLWDTATLTPDNWPFTGTDNLFD